MTSSRSETTRSGFLRAGAVALGAGAAMTADAASARPAPATGDRGRGVDPNPRYRRPRVTRLKTVTGPGITTRFRMEATDLGAPAVTPDGRILVIFGDTFEEAEVGGGWWRSPVGLRAPAYSETLLWGCRWGQEDDERVAQLYGPYVLPGSTLEELHLLCSQWNTEQGWPYHVQQYRIEGIRTAMRALGA